MACPPKGCSTRGWCGFPFAPIHPSISPTHGLFGIIQAATQPPSRGPDGQFLPVAHLGPIEDSFIGGWTMPAQRQPSPHPIPSGSNGDAGIQSGAAAPPPSLSPHLLQTGYPFVPTPPPSAPSVIHGVQPSFNQNPLSRLSAVERSQTLNRRKTVMHPYLQYMCGPLLRYDAVDEHGVWHGAAMIVSKC